MRGKKLFIWAVGLLVLMAMLVTALAGCQGSFSVSTASLSEATMCKSVDPKTARPIEKADVFAPDTPIIYCSVKLSNAPPDTEVKAQWVYLTKSKVLYEDVGTESGTYYLGLKLQAPQSGWPLGDYAVKFFIDGNEKLTVPFKVGTAQAAPSVSGGEAYLSEATMCISIDSKTAKPVEKADVFTPDTPVIYCSVKLSDAPPNTEVKAQWVYLTKNMVLYEDVGMESGTYYLGLNLQAPKNGWPVGNYAVRLFLNGQEKFTVPFKVQ